jgi:hypothetical protein
MRIARHRYSERLTEAAEEFLIGQFDAPTQFTEAGHMPDLIEAAMHIVTEAAWVQPDTYKERQRDYMFDEPGGEDAGDEDEDDE